MVAGILLGRWQTDFRTRGAVSPIENLIQRSVGLVASPITGIRNRTGDFFGSVGRNLELQAENRRLRDRLSALGLYEEQIAMLNAHVDELRKVESLPPVPGKTSISGEVIAFSVYENRVRINVGSEKGIRPGMPVVNGEGLVAVVQTVKPGESQALLVSSFGTGMGGIDINRTPPPFGLVKGRDSSTLTMELIDANANVVTGDIIVTSGFSELIPRGIVIGRVITVQDDIDFGRKRATLDPAVNTGNLHEVRILK